MASATGRYARAYAEVISAEGGDPDQAVAELNQIAELISNNNELRHVFENPSVEHRQKLALLDKIVDLAIGLKGKMRNRLRNFVAVLIDHKRIGRIAEIAAQFKQEIQLRMGIAEAQVSSARELTAAERRSLESRLAEVTGKQVRATYTRDSGLLGGAVVRVGSTIYDGSVKGQLQRMKQEISGS